MKLDLPNGRFMTALSKMDAEDLVTHLQDKDITAVTLSIPNPYTIDDARKFIASTHNSKYDFAIRNQLGHLMGHIKATNISPLQPHKATIGYWLAKRYWGHGIMTEAVKAFSNYCFEHLSLSRLGATCFETNVGSSRVLEKAGFKLEGLAEKHYHKDGVFHNAKLYGKVK